MATRQFIPRLLSTIIFAAIILGFTVSPALSEKPIEVAPGYVLQKIYEGLVPLPTCITFDKHGNLYASSLATGQISVLNLWSGHVRDLIPPGQISNPMGLVFHPTTGMLYVSHQYLADPAGDPTDVENVRSRISIINPYTSQMWTFVEDLPSMSFEALPVPVAGSQGMDFDYHGNLYVAQGINDELVNLGDIRPSSILKIDPAGNVSIFAGGLRAPYDVVVGSQKDGVATMLYAGDNGEGEENNYDNTKPSRQYFDELNRLFEGRLYGWPNGAPGYPAQDHIGALWHFDKKPYPIDAPSDDIAEWQWPVPTGIDLLSGRWGNVKNPLFLCLFGCESLDFTKQDIGTIEMFTDLDYSTRITLAKYIDGAIDVVFGPDGKLYFAEMRTGDIYRIVPQN
jgi:hypothetical protein